MDSFFLAVASAVWLGILTSISPCPLATNIAAISYIGRRVGSPGMVVLSGLFYIVGRMLTYLILGIILVASIISISELSFFLQEYMNKFLGPVLILVGIILLGFIPLSLPGIGMTERMQRRVIGHGIWGAGLLGIIFALSFCPISAALFFGSLIPLSVKHSSSILLPSIYGIGTGLPVILFAFLVAFGAGLVGKAFNRLTEFERWARRVTAVIFIVVGIYHSLIYLFGLPV